jgi:hypothetical protein
MVLCLVWGMRQHAIRTAVALYEGGTLDLKTAANKAGVSPDRLQLALRRAGGAPSDPETAAERVPVRAD